MPARYLIGIDLGTTNTAVAYVDTAAADPRVRVFEVPQLVAPGETGGLLQATPIRDARDGRSLR